MLTPTACSRATSRPHRHLALVILHQHEAPQFGTEVAADAAGQRGDNHLAIGRQPALAPVMQRAGADRQVLHVIRLVALELRAGRMRRLQHLGFHRDPRRNLAAAPQRATLATVGRLGVLLHPARLD